MIAPSRPVDFARALALQELLERPDERALRGLAGQPRGHHVTQQGARDRLAVEWLPVVDVWTARRIAASIGAFEGWKPAVRARKVARIR